jgi:hypothetical protein
LYSILLFIIGLPLRPWLALLACFWQAMRRDAIALKTARSGFTRGKKKTRARIRNRSQTREKEKAGKNPALLFDQVLNLFFNSG